MKNIDAKFRIGSYVKHAFHKFYRIYQFYIFSLQEACQTFSGLFTNQTAEKKGILRCIVFFQIQHVITAIIVSISKMLRDKATFAAYMVRCVSRRVS